MSLFSKKTVLPTAEQALTGRTQAMAIGNQHFINANPLLPPFPSQLEQAIFGMGCFWGAERKFWQQTGVFSTAVGYAGGFTPNPTYEELCSGLTGHAEVVSVVFDPAIICYQDLLRVFWESHDPTQGMRQGNDIGSQYRSVIFTCNEQQHQSALESARQYQLALDQADLGIITTQICPAPMFYYAENEHQQYLAKNPQGYCGLGGTGIAFINPALKYRSP